MDKFIQNKRRVKPRPIQKSTRMSQASGGVSPLIERIRGLTLPAR